MKKTKPVKNEWHELLTQSMRERGRHPTGPGWKTLDELAKEWDRARGTVSNMVGLLVAAGKLECFNGNALSNGRLQRRVWYRIKK